MSPQEHDEQKPASNELPEAPAGKGKGRTELIGVTCECGAGLVFDVSQASQYHRCPDCDRMVGVEGREKLGISSCRDCGTVLRSESWELGEVCPTCQSRNVFPVTVISGAVDYVIADRSRGYAIEDIRFGQLAKWLNLIGEEDYRGALQKQTRMAQSGKPVNDIAQVLVSSGHLTDEQKICLLGVFAADRPNNSDIEFAEYAQEREFISQENYDLALLEQSRMDKSVSNIPALPFMLLERRLISEPQAVSVLKFQRRREGGLLGEFDGRMATLNPPKKRMALPKKKIACLCIVLFAGAFWLSRIARARYGPRAWIPLGCKRCANMDIWQVPIDQKFPMTCPWCERRGAYLVFECHGCGQVRFEGDLYDTAVCPHCEKTRLKRLLHRKDPDSGEWYVTRLKVHDD